MKLNIFKWINERKILSKLNWRWIENITKNVKVIYTQGQSLGNTHLVWNFHLPYLKLLRSPFYAGFEGGENVQKKGKLQSPKTWVWMLTFLSLAVGLTASCNLILPMWESRNNNIVICLNIGPICCMVAAIIQLFGMNWGKIEKSESWFCLALLPFNTLL